MPILLDTHFMVWLVSDDEALRAVERRLLTETDRAVLLSSICLRELRVKALAQARRGHPPPLAVTDVIAFANDKGLRIATPDPANYAVPLHPLLVHTDPFDEMLLVHAQQLGAQLLTRDRLLRNHPLALSL